MTNQAPPVIAFLAESSPTWTDKEVLLAIGSAITLVFSLCVFIIKFCTYSARKRVREAERKASALNKQFIELTKETGNVPKLQGEIKQAKIDLEALRAELQQSEGECDKHEESVAKLASDLESLKTTSEGYANEMASQRKRIEKALRKDGQTWTEKVKHNAPDFRPLEPDGRRTPIISVVNLKGGVGKTTLTANLGAALAGRGYRTLLLDLDLQGSLSSLFLNESQLEHAFSSEQMLGDFLASAFEAENPKLLDYILPVMEDGRSGLVPTTDYLAYAEMNLTIRWLLKEGNRDPRFLLRKELHFRRVTNEYDVILLDCPPLINVSCINALGASDYVLIPILPSKQATARVPILLKRLKEFQENINPALKVLGVVCNRTLRSELTADEENRLTLLQDQCKDAWGEPVPQFETFIRQSAEVRVAEDDKRPLRPDDSMYQTFADLAEEIEGRWPLFCRPKSMKAAVPQAEGVS